MVLSSVEHPIYNVYCDESCHLENDGEPIMAFGAIWCPRDKTKDIASAIRELKDKHNARGELKWNKVSHSRLDFYMALLRLFFRETDLHFRALVVTNKDRLNHDAFNQGSHDTFYYKMYFSLLSKILDPESRYNIFLDVKDTRSRLKVSQLREVLCNNVHDFTGEMIRHIQTIPSRKYELIQLTDFMLGAVAYSNRDLSSNEAKTQIVQMIEAEQKRSMKYSTPLSQTKINIFIFSPREL